MCFRRRRDASPQDIDRPHRPAIVASVRFFLRCDHRSFERRPGEKSLASAVSVDGRSRRHAGLRIATDWPGGSTRFGAKRYISILRESAHSGVGVKNEYKVRHLRADLRTPTSAARSDKRWPRPTPIGPRHHDAFAAFATYPEPDLHHLDDGEALCLAQDRGRNASFWHPAKVSQDRGRFINNLLFGRSDRRPEGQN